MCQPGVPGGQRQCELREDVSIVSIASTTHGWARTTLTPASQGGWASSSSRFLGKGTVISKERWKELGVWLF